MDVKEIEIPADLVELATKYRAELVERIVEHDDGLMTAFLEGKEISIEALRSFRAAP